MAELYECTATELRALLEAGATTPREIVEALLARIDAHEGLVRAWQFLDPALVRADASRTRLDAGPLGGIPVGIKDLFDTADMPTAYGSRIYAGHRPAKDADCVAALRAAGSIVVGKTVTTEFASVFEPAETVNPYDPSRSPGGSSSGSAAAVADRMVPIAIGTQTAGSVIRPATYCGVLGYKPSFGAVSRAGVKLVSPSLDTIGVFARSVDDLILAASVLNGGHSGGGEPSGQRPKAESVGRREPRIAFCRTGRWDEARPAVHDTVSHAVDLLSNSGAKIEDVTLDAAFEELVEASKTVFIFELAQALAPEYATARHQMSAALISLVESGLAVSQHEYAHARHLTEEARPAVTRVLDGFDVILTPATLDEAPPFENTGDPVFCRSWTLLGNPAVTIPVMLGPNGLPIGIQIVGRLCGNSDLLRTAQWLAAALPALPPPEIDRHPRKNDAPAASPRGPAAPGLDRRMAG